MTNDELRTWERECRELTDQELKLLRQLLIMKRELSIMKREQKTRHQSEVN